MKKIKLLLGVLTISFFQVACSEVNENKTDAATAEETTEIEKEAVVEKAANEEITLIDKEELINNFNKYLIITDNLSDYKVVSFEVILYNKDVLIISQKVEDNNLPEEVIEKIRNADAGTELFLSSIQIEKNGVIKRSAGSAYKLR